MKTSIHTCILLISFLATLVFVFFPVINAGVLECYRYSPLILSQTILTRGSIDFKDFVTEGDLFRERAFFGLGNERPLTAILYTILALTMSLHLMKAPWIPIAQLASWMLIFIVVRDLMRRKDNECWYHIMLIALFIFVALLRLIGITTSDLAHAYFLLLLLIYLYQKTTATNDLRMFVLTLIAFISISMTHYSVFIFSSVFIVGSSILTAIKRKDYISPLLFMVLSLSIVFVYHTFYLQVAPNIIRREFTSMLMETLHRLFIRTQPEHSPYVDFVSAKLYTSIANLVFKFSIYVFGLYALVTCIIKGRQQWPTIVALILMSASETIIYVMLGAGMLLSTLIYISLPLIIALYVAEEIGKSHDRKKRVALLTAVCLIATFGLLHIFLLNSQWYEMNLYTPFISHSANWIRERSSYDTSYEVIASAEGSALISYVTLEPKHVIVTCPLRLSLIVDKGVKAFVERLNSDPYDLKLVVLSIRHPFIRAGAWAGYWLLKEQVYVKFQERFNIAYNDGFYIIYFSRK